MDYVSLLAVIIALLLCLITGANNAADCVGTTVGARITSKNFGLAIVAAGIICGVFFESSKLAIFGSLIANISPNLILSVLVGATIALLLATLQGIPISAAQAVIGAIVGAGMAYGWGSINWLKILIIVASWLFVPLVAIFLGVILYFLFGSGFSKIRSLALLELTITLCLLLSSFYAAYVLGANTIGLIMGVVVSLGAFSPFDYKLLVLFATIVGLLFSYRTIKTVANEITELYPTASLTGQFSASFLMHSFTQLSIPISLTHAVVGSVMGIGLTKGASGMNVERARMIARGWIIAPLISLAISYAVMKLLIF